MVQGDLRALSVVANTRITLLAKWVPMVLLVLWFAGCSTVYTKPNVYDIGEETPATSTLSDQVPDVIVLPVTPDGDQPPTDDAMYGTAAESLLESAVSARKERRTQAASLYLERAIRIAPGSSWLYKEMAELRLDESDAHSAEGFVRHALRNAPADDEAYQAALWGLLAGCLSRQGKQQQAQEAEQQARSLQTR